MQRKDVHILDPMLTIRPEEHKDYKEIVMLAPVSVHADHFRQGIGSAMIRMGIQKVREMGFKGITVEGNYRFYNQVGFRTPAEYGIYPTGGRPTDEPRFMMCQETYEGSLDGIRGYIVYDMYYNAYERRSGTEDRPLRLRLSSRRDKKAQRRGEKSPLRCFRSFWMSPYRISGCGSVAVLLDIRRDLFT